MTKRTSSLSLSPYRGALVKTAGPGSWIEMKARDLRDGAQNALGTLGSTFRAVNPKDPADLLSAVSDLRGRMPSRDFKGRLAAAFPGVDRNTWLALDSMSRDPQTAERLSRIVALPQAQKDRTFGAVEPGKLPPLVKSNPTLSTMYQMVAGGNLRDMMPAAGQAQDGGGIRGQIMRSIVGDTSPSAMLDLVSKQPQVVADAHDLQSAWRDSRYGDAIRSGMNLLPFAASGLYSNTIKPMWSRYGKPLWDRLVQQPWQNSVSPYIASLWSPTQPAEAGAGVSAAAGTTGTAGSADAAAPYNKSLRADGIERDPTKDRVASGTAPGL